MKDLQCLEQSMETLPKMGKQTIQTGKITKNHNSIDKPPLLIEELIFEQVDF